MFANRFDPDDAKSKANKKLALLAKLKNKKSSVSTNGNPVEHVENKDDGDIVMEDINEHKNTEANLELEAGRFDDKNLKRKREEESEESEESESSSSTDSSDDEDNDQENHEDVKETDISEVPTAYASVFSRFKEAMSKKNEDEDNEDNFKNTEKDEELIDYKDVAPLPQLELPKDKTLYSQTYKNKTLDWLTKPVYYESNLSKPFTKIEPKINDILIKNLKNEFNIENAFSVQISLIEELLKDINSLKLNPFPKGDYLINAATGSGKTLSYLIPIMQSLIADSNTIKIKDSGIKCIIIVPTKPLVQQVYNDSLKLSKGLDVNIISLKSGGELNLIEETKKLESNLIDILITTPGRLVDHLKFLNLHNLKFLVVDEADRLLNQNFQDWCDLIINKIEKYNNDGNNNLDFNFKLRCIKIILSATLTTNSEKLSHLRLFKPRLVIIKNDKDSKDSENGKELYQLPDKLTEMNLRISEKLNDLKPLILLNLFKWVDKNNNKYDNFGLIFTKSNETSIRLHKLLSLLNNQFNFNLNIKIINSMMNNQDKDKILKNFNNEGGILICTDLLSRGINLTSIKFVINYDLPNSTKEYIHRVGRTARAGNKGNAITLIFGDNEFKWFKKLVYSGKQINRNNKTITDIKFIKEINSEIDNENDELFKLNITSFDKDIYKQCLKNLD